MKEFRENIGDTGEKIETDLSSQCGVLSFQYWCPAGSGGEGDLSRCCCFCVVLFFWSLDQKNVVFAFILLILCFVSMTKRGAEPIGYSAYQFTVVLSGILFCAFFFSK